MPCQSSRLASAVPFEGEVARVYEAGRRMTLSEIDTWTGQLAQRLYGRAVTGAPCILDLGSGTGRFSPALAEACSASVIAVEPSEDMRRIATRQNPHRRVAYRSGTAERIPLPTGACDAAFLFLSLHHFSDRTAASQELARVCKPGSPIVIRTEFSDRPHLAYWHSLLPTPGAIDRALYPRAAEVSSELNSAGIEILAVHRIPYRAADSLKEYVYRLGLASLSALRIYGKTAVHRDLSKLRFTDAELTQPVYEVGHLVVCERAASYE